MGYIIIKDKSCGWFEVYDTKDGIMDYWWFSSFSFNKIQDILQKEFARVSKEHPVVFCRNGEIIERSPDGTERLIKKLH